MTEYEPRGYLRLTRRPEAKLSEESEEYANLYLTASRWGYRLLRKTIREDVEYFLMKHSLSVLTFRGDDSGDADGADLFFSWSPVDLDDINHLEATMADFFEDIREECGVDGQFDCNFIPDDGQSDTISLVCYPNSQVVFRLELSYSDDMADPVYEDPAAGDDFDGLGVAPAVSEAQPGQAAEHRDDEDDWARI